MSPDGGLVLVDKPAGPSSHDIVRALRRATGERRVGHTGTLDPFATGLLLLVVGRFTRAAECFHALSKTYRATLRLGRETDTDDLTGEPTGEGDWSGVSRTAVQAALTARKGSGEQVPATYSAKRLGGRRAYEAARSGAAVELAPVSVVIHDVRLETFDPPDAVFTVRVSTGTYVRALARDLGRDLGCGAHLRALRRTAIGPFRVEDAMRPEDFDLDPSSAGPAAWRSPAEALAWLPRRCLTRAEADSIERGQPIERGDVVGAATGTEWIAAVEDERLVALVVPDGKGSLAPRKVFPG